MLPELSMQLRNYLRHCGLSESELANCNGSTRMYHDLGLYGDIAEAYIEVLAKQYGVDISGFVFDDFFPNEFAGNNMLSRALLWIIPFAGKVTRQRKEYLPLTLARVDRALHNKRWE